MAKQFTWVPIYRELAGRIVEWESRHGELIELLEQLRTRLLEEPSCAPQCASVAQLELQIDPARLRLRAEVHAQATTTYQAPGPLESWAPDEVRVDGRDAFAAVRSADGFLHVRLEPGVHQVELSGPVPHNQAFTLALGTPPHYVRAEHKGFLIYGQDF